MGSYRYTQAQNDAVLALHAMETAAYSLGLGCVILGSLLNDVPALIDLLNLPEYTYPVLGLAIGKPDQDPALKPRMPRSMQFFENEYPSNNETLLAGLQDFDEEVRIGITICAIPSAQLIRSAIRSRRMRSIPV